MAWGRAAIRSWGLGAALAILVASTGAGARAQAMMAVPSGQPILPYEALWEDHVAQGSAPETWLILRFLAPEIAREGGRIGFAEAEPDLDYLCARVGLPLAASTGGGVDLILVTLLEKPLPRGERTPEVRKFIAAYRVENGACRWEG